MSENPNGQQNLIATTADVTGIESARAAVEQRIDAEQQTAGAAAER